MTRTAHRTAAARNDPQSGPSRAAALSDFFRLSAKWILAKPGRLAGLRLSRYINREGRDLDREGVAVGDRLFDADRSLVRAAHYVVRSADGRVDPANAELGAHVLITRGLRARNGVELARLLDAAERKPDGTYRCHGGRLPRVGVHMIASFSRGLSPEAAGAILEDYAQALSDRLQVPLEGQVHNDDDGQPDHAHLILGTRVVEAGVIGKKARALDAVSEKADGNAMEIGGRLVGNTIEWIRSEWAARMRAATGMEVDHRSFARQGLAITPVTYVPRTEVEYQRRRGSTAWKDRRRRELADRSRTHAPRTRPHERAMDPSLIEVETTPVSAAEPRGVAFDQDERTRRPTPVRGAPGERSASDQVVDTQHATEASVSSYGPVTHTAEPGSGSPEPSLGRATVIERLALLTSRSISATAALAGSLGGTPGPVASFLHDMGLDLPAEIVTAALYRRRLQPQGRTIDDAAEHKASGAMSPLRSPGLPHEVEPIATTGTATLRTKTETEVEWAFRLSCLLRRKRRLRRSRLAQLARWADLPVEALEARLHRVSEAESEEMRFEAMRHGCPTDLQRMWDDWAAEDNAERRVRRGGGADHPVLEPDRAGPGVQDTGSVGMNQAVRSAYTAFASSSAPPETRQTDHTEPQPFTQATRLGEDRIRPRPETPSPVTVPEAPPFGADALSGAAAAARDRMLVETFEADVNQSTLAGGERLVNAQEFDRAIALRLRVTGRNRTEVAAALGAKWSVIDEASEARITAAVDHAFSDHSTRVIEQQKGWVAWVNSLSAGSEMRFYRTLRTQTLRDLRQDLEAVWTNRALRANEARRRHADRLAALHGMRWYARRLKRCGFVVSVLATMVELTVLKPLLAQAKAAASAEQEAIVSAVQTLSRDLKRRRAEWIAFAPAQARRQTMAANRRAATDTVPVEPNSTAPAQASMTGKAPPGSSAASRAVPDIATADIMSPSDVVRSGEALLPSEGVRSEHQTTRAAGNGPGLKEPRAPEPGLRPPSRTQVKRPQADQDQPTVIDHRRVNQADRKVATGDAQARDLFRQGAGKREPTIDRSSPDVQVIGVEVAVGIVPGQHRTNRHEPSVGRDGRSGHDPTGGAAGPYHGRGGDEESGRSTRHLSPRPDNERARTASSDRDPAPAIGPKPAGVEQRPAEHPAQSRRIVTDEFDMIISDFSTPEVKINPGPQRSPAKPPQDDKPPGSEQRPAAGQARSPVDTSTSSEPFHDRRSAGSRRGGGSEIAD